MNELNGSASPVEGLEDLLLKAQRGGEIEIQTFLDEAEKRGSLDSVFDWLDENEIAMFKGFANPESPGLLNFGEDYGFHKLYLTENGNLVSEKFEDDSIDLSFVRGSEGSKEKLASAIVDYVIEHNLDIHLAVHFNWNESITREIDSIFLEAWPNAFYCEISESVVPVDLLKEMMGEKSKIYQRVSDFLQNPTTDNRLLFKPAIDPEGLGDCSFLFS